MLCKQLCCCSSNTLARPSNDSDLQVTHFAAGPLGERADRTRSVSFYKESPPVLPAWGDLRACIAPARCCIVHFGRLLFQNALLAPQFEHG